MTDAADPFPRDPFVAVLRRLPAYGRLAWHLGRDPLVSRARRAAVLAAAGYLVSPIDLVPGFIPVLGQLDDIAVVLAALRLALEGLSPDRRRAHLEAVGLREDDLTSDLRALGSTGAWVGRAGLRGGGRLTVAGARLAGRGARALGGTALRAGRSIAARRSR